MKTARRGSSEQDKAKVTEDEFFDERDIIPIFRALSIDHIPLCLADIIAHRDRPGILCGLIDLLF